MTWQKDVRQIRLSMGEYALRFDCRPSCAHPNRVILLWTQNPRTIPFCQETCENIIRPISASIDFYICRILMLCISSKFVYSPTFRVSYTLYAQSCRAIMHITRLQHFRWWTSASTRFHFSPLTIHRCLLTSTQLCSPIAWWWHNQMLEV